MNTVMERKRRVAALSQGRGRRRGHERGAAAWKGEPAAIYCRISKASDNDQTGVDRQERLCREVAERLGLEIPAAGFVFVDNNRSAWQRNRKRPGWDAMLEGMQAGRFQHLIVYHPDRLMRQPYDLEELLKISDDFDVTLHGQANRRDLSDPDDRFFLRIEVAHACRSSDDTSRRLKDAFADKARGGRPHVTGRRRFGYQANGVDIELEEAAAVREMYARYLDGQSPMEITQWLRDLQVPTVTGAPWNVVSVRRILKSPHVTGLLVFHGEVVGEGDWPAIIDRGTWEEVQERRTYRASAHKQRPHKFFLLRGLVTCTKCGRRMSGTRKGRTGGSSYSCNGLPKYDGDQTCSRTIHADKLEAFVSDAAVKLLTDLDVTGSPSDVEPSEIEQAAVEAERTELAELKEMWEGRELSTREYRSMRMVVEERLSKLRKRAVVRPTAEILSGLVGRQAREKWDAFVEAGEVERLNAVLRFLFAAVLIDEHHGNSAVFDYGRINIEPNPL